MLAVLGASLIGAQIAHAQNDTIETATQGHACAEDQYQTLGGKNTLGCTAGDLSASISAQVAGNTVGACPIGTQATVDIEFTLQSNQADRYDVGLFIGENGNSPIVAGGTCSATIFPTTPTGNNVAGGQWFSANANACGDYNKSSTTNNLIQGAKVLCQGDASGHLVVPFAIIYLNNVGGSAGCANLDQVTADNPSKCTSVAAAPISNVFVTTDANPSCGNAGIQFVPTDATGGTVTKTFTISNSDVNHNQAADGTQFEDNLTLNTPAVTVTNVTCGNEQGGAVCGAMTVANDAMGTITTLPFGGSVDITITGTVAPCPGGCTYTNNVNLITPPTVLPPNPPYTRDPATGISTYTTACSAQATLPVKLQSFDVK